jgi:hypothetical protein
MIGSSIVSSPEDGLDKLAKHARGVLVVLAVVQLAGTAILYVAGAVREPVDIGVAILLGVVFGGLAIWARKDPLTAVLVGLGMYVTLVLLSAIIEPATLFSGLILKVIVAAMFWNGISTGLTYNEMKRTLGTR